MEALLERGRGRVGGTFHPERLRQIGLGRNRRNGIKSTGGEASSKCKRGGDSG